MGYVFLVRRRVTIVCACKVDGGISNKVRLRRFTGDRRSERKRFVNVQIEIIIEIVLVKVNGAVKGAERGFPSIAHLDFAFDAGGLGRWW